jgi:exodeoxyribonuclease-1
MADSFYWYDLETTGTNPKWDRIVQFAGFRTDEDLNPIGDEYSTYVKLPDDVLPNPDATMVTGITPELLAREGIKESQALGKINQLFSEPGTCVLGYNSLRFDDEFMRYSLYRNLMDPYAREWQNGNSRWDLIDLVRATGALRHEGINWPQNEEGLPVYKLEELTKANGIEHGQAHDAMSDVRATLSMAKLIKAHQPKLFDYYFAMRNKKKVRNILEPYGVRLCVHINAMYPRERYGVAPIVSIGRHPTNNNSIIVVDLAADIETLIESSEDEIRSKLFKPGKYERPPLKEIRINRCPFIAPLDVLNDENISRLGFSMRQVKERARRLKQPGIVDKIKRVFVQGFPDKASDVDAGLYDGFLQDEDRARCNHFHNSLAQGVWQDMDYRDSRLHVLAQRLKARSFPELMSTEDQSQWEEFVQEKLQLEGDWLSLEGYNCRLKELAATDLTAEKYAILESLKAYGRQLQHRYRLEVE